MSVRPDGRTSAESMPGHALVGREDELHRLHRLLAAHRFVTVTGPGGVGKTSLALTAVQHPWPGPEPVRVVVCELADIETPEAVRHAVGAHLEIVVRSDAPLSTVLRHEDDATLLVVLDNCEHVLGAASDVARELLDAGPRVRVLTTSREPLGTPGEHVMVLGPLPVPAVGDEDAGDAPAVSLFVQRAQLADATFVLDRRTLPHVVQVCRALDGIPLALEIAAARCGVLGVSDIAERLAERFTLLRTRGRRGPERHRDLRAVIDWSYDLLEHDERELLTRLAVHAGGCALETAMAAGATVGLSRAQVVDALEGLTSKSLVTVTVAESGTRYGQLDSVRLYAVEKLEEQGLLRETRDRHADHYAAVARRLRADLLHAWDESGLSLFVEFDNFRSALTWVLVADDGPDRSFDLLAQMWYLALQFRAEEVAEWAARALERWTDPTHPLWSEVAGTLATACATLEDFPRADQWATRAVSATGSSGVGAAFGWCALAEVACKADDDPRSALDHLDRADAAAEAAGFEPLRCDVMGRRAQVLAHAGREDEARAAAERARVMARDQGNVFETAWSQHLLGLLLTTSDPETAREWLTAALADSRRHHYFYGIHSSARGLGGVWAVLGDHARAAGLLAEALTGFVRSGHLGERWNTVAASLPLLVAAGREEVAATLLIGLEEQGAVVYRIHAPLLDDVRARLAQLVTSPQVLARGRALGPGELLETALRELRALSRPPADPGTPRGEPAVRADDVGELTRTGAWWRVTYAGTTVHLPDLRGIHDLAVLLAAPGREHLALDLASASGVDRRVAAPGDSAEVPGVGVEGDLGERLDARARAAYAARIEELQNELDDAAAEDERAPRAQEELDFLVTELSAAYGLRGPRRAGDPAEKARSTVTARIRAAIAKVQDVHPELARHLRSSIRTGRFCSYRPDHPTRWQVSR